MLTCSARYYLNLHAIHEGKQRGFLLPLLVPAPNALWCSGSIQVNLRLCSQGCLVAGLRRRQCSIASVFPTSDTGVIASHNATEVIGLLVPSVGLILGFFGGKHIEICSREMLQKSSPEKSQCKTSAERFCSYSRFTGASAPLLRSVTSQHNGKLSLIYSSHSLYTLSFFHSLLDYIKITRFHWGHL